MGVGVAGSILLGLWWMHGLRNSEEEDPLLTHDLYSNNDSRVDFLVDDK